MISNLINKFSNYEFLSLFLNKYMMTFIWYSDHTNVLFNRKFHITIEYEDMNISISHLECEANPLKYDKDPKFRNISEIIKCRHREDCHCTICDDSDYHNKKIYRLPIEY